jgi:ATP-dependent Lon protease
MILPLFVGREKSVQAVDAALNGSRYIFISTQKDESVDDPPLMISTRPAPWP